jgi:hypothetical protein
MASTCGVLGLDHTRRFHWVLNYIQAFILVTHDNANIFSYRLNIGCYWEFYLRARFKDLNLLLWLCSNLCDEGQPQQ